VYNARFVKPLDYGMLDCIARKHQVLITIEDGVVSGGYGQAVLAYMQSSYSTKVYNIGHADRHITDLDIKSALAKSGISVQGLEHVIEQMQVMSKIRTK
jgi:1-deoxy-D-xylulose-5-phosphate synthase